MLALADESSRTGGGGLYLIAVVMLPLDRAVEVRALLRGMLPPRQRRFHWRADNERLRANMLEAIERSGARAAVFVKKPMLGASHRRGRALCLESALWYLRDQRIFDLVIESRGAQDQDDRRTVIAARRSGKADRDLRYSFARPLEEPLLWLADAIAGAVSACEADARAPYADALERLQVLREAVR